MDMRKLVKPGMILLGMALTAGANFVQSKQQENAMKEEIAKEVAKTLSGQAKES